MTKNLADELQRTARQALAGLQPSQQGEELGGMPVRRLLAAVFRGRYLLFGATVFGLLIGAFLGITTPNTYVSEGKFQFQAVGAERETVGPGASSQTSQESIATGASYVLETNDLLQRVVDRLGAARILQPYQPGDGSDSGAKGLFFSIQREWNATKASDRTPEAALKQLKRSITLERPRDTNVLIARYAANDAKLAKEVLTTWMDEAIKWHIEKYDNVKAYEAARKALEDALLARDLASKAENDFLLKKAKVSQFEEEKARLEKAEVEDSTKREKQLEDLQALKSELAGLDLALDVDKTVKATIPGRVKLDPTSAARKLIETEMGKVINLLIEAKVSGLRDSPAQVQSLERRMQAYKDELAKAEREAADAPEVESLVTNPEYEEKQKRRGKLRTDINELENRLKFAGEHATTQRDQLAKLLELEPEYLRLRDARVAAAAAVVTCEFRWNAATQKRELSGGGFSTLKDMQQASLPLEKEAPNRGKLVLGAVLVGLFFGFAVILLRSLPDTVVRTREDLEQIESLAVIGVMPRLDGINLRRHGALREQGW